MGDKRRVELFLFSGGLLVRKLTGDMDLLYNYRDADAVFSSAVFEDNWPYSWTVAQLETRLNLGFGHYYFVRKVRALRCNIWS